MMTGFSYVQRGCKQTHVAAGWAIKMRNCSIVGCGGAQPKLRAQPRCQALFTWLTWTHLMQSLRKLLSLVPPFDRGTEVQRGWSFILEEQIAKLGCWGAEPWVFSSKLALLVGKKRGAQGTRLSPASLSKQILLPAACRLLEENINNTLFLSHSYFFL